MLFWFARAVARKTSVHPIAFLNPAWQAFFPSLAAILSPNMEQSMEMSRERFSWDNCGDAPILGLFGPTVIKAQIQNEM